MPGNGRGEHLEIPSQMISQLYEKTSLIITTEGVRNFV